jgi:hypothetical protein
MVWLASSSPYRASATAGLRAIAAFTIALVIFRSLVWIIWPQSHFDSDQSIYGLMAKHLAEGRALPIFMYGQSYMLAVEAWLAAPFVGLGGTSVWTLKLPLLVINAAAAVLLIRFLVRDARLTRWQAFAAALWFTAAPPIVSSRLVEAAGGNIEPFLYGLVLWGLRGRPVWFGLAAGFGIAHREFTAYAVVAVVLLELRWGALANRRAAVGRSVSLVLTFLTIAAIRTAGGHGSIMGPGTAGTLNETVMHLDLPARVCRSTAGLLSGSTWFVAHPLATLIGARVEPLSSYNLNSRLGAGHAWLTWIPLVLVSIAIAALLVRTRSAGNRADPPASVITEPGRIPARSFSSYLVLIGAQAALGYVLVACDTNDILLIRYALLALFGLVGVTAWIFQTARLAVVRQLVSAALVAWLVASLWDHTRLLDAYLRHPPPNAWRQLITYLDEHDLRAGIAPYWTAYVVDYLSGERVILGSSDVVRILSYQTRAPLVRVDHAPCPNGVAVVRLQSWCVEPIAAPFTK